MLQAHIANAKKMRQYQLQDGGYRGNAGPTTSEMVSPDEADYPKISEEFRV